MLQTYDAARDAGSALGALVALREYRQPRGMFPSEKMRGPVHWTSAAQLDAITLFEVHHGVSSYATWPPDAVVSLPGETAYRLPLGVTFADGSKAAMDYARQEHAGTPARIELDRLLAQGLERIGTRYIPVAEDSLRRDPRLPVARLVVRAAGWPVGQEGEFDLVDRLHALGGAATVADLRSTGPDGAALVGTACVLGMRGVVRIDLAPRSLDQCRVSLPAFQGRGK